METIQLSRPSCDVPWGFRLAGGADNQQPITVQRVMPGSIAAQGLVVGDVIAGIGDSDASALSSSAAMELVKQCGDSLQFRLLRGGNAKLTGQVQSQQSAMQNHLNGTKAEDVKPLSCVTSTPSRLQAAVSPRLEVSPVSSPRSDATSSSRGGGGINRSRPPAPQSATNFSQMGTVYGQPVKSNRSQQSSPAPSSQMGSDYGRDRASQADSQRTPLLERSSSLTRAETTTKDFSQNQENRQVQIDTTQPLLQRVRPTQRPLRIEQVPRSATDEQQQLNQQSNENQQQAQLLSPQQQPQSETSQQQQQQQSHDNQQNQQPHQLPRFVPHQQPGPTPQQKQSRYQPLQPPAPRQLQRQHQQQPQQSNENVLQQTPQLEPVPQQSQLPIQDQCSPQPQNEQHFVNPQQQRGPLANQRTPGSQPRGHQVGQQPQIPVAVQNMAARAGGKTPFSYAPDLSSLQQQTNRVRQQRQNPNLIQKQMSEGAAYAAPQIRGNLSTAAELRRQRRRELGLEPEFPNSSISEPLQSQVADGSSTASTESAFDENVYQSGNVSFLDGEPRQTQAGPVVDQHYERVKEEEREKEKPFDERAYLAGRIPLVQGGQIDPSTFKIAAPVTRPPRRQREEDKPKLDVPFNEQAYLSGQINILGNPTQRAALPPRPKPAATRASWQKDDKALLSEDEYSEESFLKGSFNLVRKSLDRETPVKARMNTGPRRFRERAPWEREQAADEAAPGSDAEFDENAFLSGRLYKQDSSSREQSIESDVEGGSRNIRVLRRSASNDRRLDKTDDVLVGFNCFSEDDAAGAGSDYDKTYNDYVYVGKNIPSRTFLRLKKTMARKTLAERNRTPADSIERLKNKPIEAQNHLDVEKAVDQLPVENLEPEKYLELLKNSVQQNDTNTEAETPSQQPAVVEAEATDF